MKFWEPTVKNLKKINPSESGVYVIKRRSDGKITYVGESHTGRLRKTLARHFQKWTGPAAGNRYNKETHEVSVITTHPSKAIIKQNALINALTPLDNIAGQPPTQAKRRTTPKKEENAWDPF